MVSWQGYIFVSAFLSGLIAKQKAGLYQSILDRYAFSWREHKDSFAIKHAIEAAARLGDTERLQNMINDKEFRRLREHLHGLNDLRSDLELCRQFFSAKHMAIEYIKTIFFEQSTHTEGVEWLSQHRQYCSDYDDFLQLNIPKDMRRDIGLDRVLRRVFSLALQPNRSAHVKEIKSDAGVHTVELLDYEIGEWSCDCGFITGEASRYVDGNNYALSGDHHPDDRSCQDAKRDFALAYFRCPKCGSHVTLDLVRKIRSGRVEGSDYELPLIIKLRETRAGIAIRDLVFVLLYIPVILGMDQYQGAVLSEMPDVFSLDRAFASVREFRARASRFVSLRDKMRYDRQSDFRKILEAVLRRTLTETGRRSLRTRLNRVLVDDKARSTKELAETLSTSLQRRLFFATCADSLEDSFLRSSGTSAECHVAANGQLKGEMAILNRDAVRRGGLSTHVVRGASVSLIAGQYGSDELTPTPAGAARHDALDNNGIVRIGQVINPGDRLVGVERPAASDMSPEEKLLRAIFGEKVGNSGKDVSLFYDGTQPARVLSIDVNIASTLQFPQLHSANGLSVTRGATARLQPFESARVEVVLAIEQPIETGDALVDRISRAVVCKIVNRSSMIRYSGKHEAIPDILVAPDHPWVQESPDGEAKIKLSINSGALHGLLARSRGLGAYLLRTKQAMAANVAGGNAQTIDGDSFKWLLAVGASEIANELISRREPSSRIEFYRSIVANDAEPHVVRSTIQDSGVMHYVFNLLAAVRINMATNATHTAFLLRSDQDIRSKSFGTVLRPDTINVGSNKPEPDGLFCSKIFGPFKDYQCLCGEYSTTKDRGNVCERCGVERTLAKVRGERMGHIELASPIVHPWFFLLDQSILCMLLERTPRDVIGLIYGERFIVLDSGATHFAVGQEIIEEEIVRLSNEIWQSQFKVCSGGEAIRVMLSEMAENVLIHKMNNSGVFWSEISTGSFEGGSANYLASGSKLAELLAFDTIPVLPPELRPQVCLEGGKIVTDDLNPLYGNVVSANNRLKRLIELKAPFAIINFAKRALQKSVDQLFCSKQPNRHYHYYKPESRSGIEEHLQRIGRKPLMLDNLLETNLDYSARVRTVFGLTDSIDHASVPERLAWDLFRPLVIRAIRQDGRVPTLKKARHEIELRSPVARSALSKAVNGAAIVVHLSGCPYQMMSFIPTLTEGLSLELSVKMMDLIGCSALGAWADVFAHFSIEAVLARLIHQAGEGGQ